MNSYTKLILELKRKRDHLESELAKKEEKQEDLEYEIEEKKHSYELVKSNEEEYTNLKNTLENFNETIKNAKKIWFWVWLGASTIVLAFIVLFSTGFASLLSDTLFLDAAIFATEFAILPVLACFGALCIKDYRKETYEIRRTKKNYTIAELDQEIANARSKAEEYSKGIESLEEAKKENDNSIQELKQQIDAITKEIDVIIESQEKAMAMPQIEELLNKAFETSPELNLIRERRNPEK